MDTDQGYQIECLLFYINYLWLQLFDTIIKKKKNE